ncbi:MAG: 23S rRNA (uracil(1939)-C(5))-methyltransferase RlmD [Tissierellia bacterium]|nr:23S rRNA (uracil(1939)-C(5))-methyltransferase RlmD [Tissierellia bacterium]
MEKFVDLEIIDINNDSKGVAKKEQLIYFVENAQIGEKVRAEVLEYKKNFATARKLETIEKSAYFEESKCIYSNICDGCSFQDINYQAQVEYKRNKIINQINRMAYENLTTIPFLEADKRYEYRNKIEVKVDIYGNISYFSRKTNRNVAIKKCIIANPKINEIISIIQEKIYEYELTGYDPYKNKGFIKNIMIRSTNLDEVMVVLVLNQNQEISDFLKSLFDTGKIDSLYTTINTKKNNYKIMDTKLIGGKEKIQEKLGEQIFLISPKSFLQVNTDMSYKIYLKAKEYIKNLNPDLLIDLYSGISTTSIILSDIVKRIISVEIVEDAIKDAKENAKLNNVDNITWINKPAEVAINELQLKTENTMALFDPPRKGLDPNIIQKIGNSNINNIVYISCNPATLARDIKLFKEFDFTLKEVIGVDMFVNTLHVEVLVLMTRE